MHITYVSACALVRVTDAEQLMEKRTFKFVLWSMLPDNPTIFFFFLADTVFVLFVLGRRRYWSLFGLISWTHILVLAIVHVILVLLELFYLLSLSTPTTYWNGRNGKLRITLNKTWLLLRTCNFFQRRQFLILASLYDTYQRHPN